VSEIQPMFQRVAVIGLGLIGGSLAKAIRDNGLAVTVVGADKRADELALGTELGVIDEAAGSVAEALLMKLPGRLLRLWPAATLWCWRYRLRQRGQCWRKSGPILAKTPC